MKNFCNYYRLTTSLFRCENFLELDLKLSVVQRAPTRIRRQKEDGHAEEGHQNGRDDQHHRVEERLPTECLLLLLTLLFITVATKCSYWVACKVSFAKKVLGL